MIKMAIFSSGWQLQELARQPLKGQRQAKTLLVPSVNQTSFLPLSKLLLPPVSHLNFQKAEPRQLISSDLQQMVRQMHIWNWTRCLAMKQL
jgi:hypothetical protein